MQSTTSRWLAMSNAVLVNDAVQINTTRWFLLATCCSNILSRTVYARIRGIKMAFKALPHVRLKRQDIAGLLGGRGKQGLAIWAIQTAVSVDLGAQEG